MLRGVLAGKPDPIALSLFEKLFPRSKAFRDSGISMVEDEYVPVINFMFCRTCLHLFQEFCLGENKLGCDSLKLVSRFGFTVIWIRSANDSSGGDDTKEKD
jgi:hypothetical protein